MTADAVGGVWQYALELARGLSAHGNEVFLAVMGPAPKPDQRQAAGEIPGLVLLHGDFQLEWMPDASADVARAGDWLLEVERDVSPDLVHVNGYAHAALPWRAPVLVAAHSCVRSWWRAVHGSEAPGEWEDYGEAVAQGLHAADLVVAPTQAFLSVLTSIYGPLRQSRVIWNGREPSRYGPAAEKAGVLTAGRAWDRAKNIDALSEIAPWLACPILVAGERQPPGTAASAAPMALQYLGRLDDGEMRRCYARAAVFALPARYEPFGLAVLEAALSGCALLLSDIRSFRELWTRAAVFVRPDDTVRLRALLGWLLEEPEIAAELGRKARRRAERYSTRRMLAGYEAAYGTLLASSRRTDKRDNAARRPSSGTERRHARSKA